MIGAFDSRITFYSQQVRALSIVHALKATGVLNDGVHVAVVGAGAAGVTAAAAAALLGNVHVHLYEREDDVLPMQRATSRRRLDPHIYGWPNVTSDDSIADLPLLDWKSGPARDVRNDVADEFAAIKQAVPHRLNVYTQNNIRDVRPVGGRLELDIRRAPRVGEISRDIDGQIQDGNVVDLLLLAFGFGLEAGEVFPGVPNTSYWLDGGVPGPQFEGNATPRFLVSGNGDGGLIDLVAAASANFDHAGTIEAIVNQPDIDSITSELLAIDHEALAALREGRGFDFIGEYDARIRPDLERMGLIARMAGRLRRGVRLTLQTLKPEVFSIETATLNRVAAYLVIRACALGGQAEFRHFHGADIAKCDAPSPLPYPALYWFTCSGQRFGVDKVIVRRGPDRITARVPFANVLAGYEDAHKDWSALHGTDAIVPRLGAAARAALKAKAREFLIPAAKHSVRHRRQHEPNAVRIQRDEAMIRWSGDVAPAEVTQLWDSGQNELEVLVPGSPDSLGPVAAALVRLVLHARNASFVGDPTDWKAFVEKWTSKSTHAENLSSPPIRPNPSGVTRDPTLATSDDIALSLHKGMSRWLLGQMNVTIEKFVSLGRDDSYTVGFVAAPDLRSAMRTIWHVWRGQFEADDALLDRFLRLVICAEDDDARQDEARVLLGPNRLSVVTRAVAAALAIAAAWQDTAPRNSRPGNLSRGLDAFGHACGAERIGGRPMSIAAVSFMWNTDFVLLSHLTAPPTVEFLAQSSLAEVGDKQPRLSQPGNGGMFMALDSAFHSATEAGLAAMTEFVKSVEHRHFERLRAEVA
ncbi:ABC-three component system protein [Nevskia ramosa]|uniref:ABC-three component system protein n=1 Tax=Nevskia ramosa TaxID=64002 RepID=UPI0003B4DA63|nr:ABC-three component system protein [Nevskia ramosa]